MPEKDHIVSPRIYIMVLLALMALLVLTLIAAFVDLDRMFGGGSAYSYWNMGVALLIAISKAVLIVLFFMHVKYSSKLTWAFASAAFVWLGIMLVLTMSDYATRTNRTGPRVAENNSTPTVIRPSPLTNTVNR